MDLAEEDLGAFKVYELLHTLITVFIDVRMVEKMLTFISIGECHVFYYYGSDLLWHYMLHVETNLIHFPCPTFLRKPTASEFYREN
jgi:hypothetical protein